MKDLQRWISTIAHIKQRKHKLILVLLIVVNVFLSPTSARAKSLSTFLFTPEPSIPCVGGILTTLVLDGVELDLCTSFELGNFNLPGPSDPQIATAVDINPFREFSIKAVPFGLSLPSDALLVAREGIDVEYRAQLHEFRLEQEGNPQVGPTAFIFNENIVSSLSVVPLKINGIEETAILILEWVVEAGDRLWIIRVSQQYLGETDTSQVLAAANQLTPLSLNSKHVDKPSTLLHIISTGVPEKEILSLQQADRGSPVQILDNLPSPIWWNGDCDTNNYYAQTGRPAYPLGGSYRGVKACGPRPAWDNVVYEPIVYFFPGAWGQYEWECVELSMRYLYLAYGINPYGANGKDVVGNYSGTVLSKIANGTPGKAPQPGDVLSYGPTDLYGHTSVVEAVNIDGNGNGTINVIEQNSYYSPSGIRTQSVTNWYVNDSLTVIGWLHGGDFSKPAITVEQQPAASQWHNINQLISWSITDTGGSGVRGYKYSWDVTPPAGTEVGGSAGSISMIQGKHTLYIQAWDNAGNPSEIITVGPFWFDNVAPTGSLSIQNGSTVTYSTTVDINTQASDSNSQVAAMRFRDGGQASWSSWYSYPSVVYWTLPNQTGQTLAVDAQFKDYAGNISLVVSDNIQLDIYPAPPSSSEFVVIKSTFGSAGGAASTSNYAMNGTLGQPAIGSMQSSGYKLYAGYWSVLMSTVQNYAISGNTGIGGALITYPGGSVTSDLLGNYIITVPAGWSGTVTPSKVGYGFNPHSKDYSNLTNNLVNENYIATILPEAFNKTSPASGTINQPANPTLQWGSSSDAEFYEYCYDATNDNACSNWVSAGTNTSISLSGLATNTTYYWHVRANNAGGTTYANGSSTTFWSFTTGSTVTVATFTDVPVTYWAWSFIERLYNAGITGGCATTPNLLYCPDATVTRAQMAVFLLKSMHGAGFNPPLVGDSTGFGDVATSHWAAPWIKQLAAEGITGGCGNGNYCPEAPVTRAQMAVFLLKAKNGSGYIPPLIGDGSGFTDVPDNYWAAVWIKQLAADGITGGCGAGVYCPENPVTRAQMAVFIVKTFGLP
jgi:hypothetical protein